MRTSIETAEGRYFDFANIGEADININDIARSLSNICRYGGHIDRFYSVAEHAVLVHDMVNEAEEGEATPQLLLAALHHDSHEAYVGDTPSPLKRIVGHVFEEMVNEIDTRIAALLGIDVTLFYEDIIHAADAEALRWEAAHMKDSRGLGEHWGQNELPRFMTEKWKPGLAPAQAKQAFLHRHRDAIANLVPYA